jgi:hypothetical protein
MDLIRRYLTLLVATVCVLGACGGSVADQTFPDGGVWIGLGHGFGSVPGGTSTPLSRPIEGHFANLIVTHP